jgi:electron transfer flavoprotein beta subunit
VAVGIGGEGYEQQLRTALAMGATRGIHAQCMQSLDPWNVARLLRAIVEREHPDLVVMGKQAVDDDANQTGQFLAALLDWPQATFVSRLDIADKSIQVERETDHGIETLELPLPAVVTTDLRLNEPRYASLAGIMKAKKKPLNVITAEELGVTIEPRVEVLRFHSADTQRRCIRVNSIDELIDKVWNGASAP